MQKSKWNIIIILAVSAVMLILLFTLGDPATIWQTLMSADMRYLMLAALLMVVFWYLESVILRQVAQGMGHTLTRGASFRVSMVGQFFNNITPFASGGQPVQAYCLTKYGISFGEGGCILLIKFVVYQLTMIIYALAVTVLKFSFFNENVAGFMVFMVLGFASNVVAVSMIAAVGFFPRATNKIAHGLVTLGTKIHIVRHKEHVLARVDSELAEFYKNFLMVREHASVLFVPLITTGLQLTAYFMIPYCIFLALGQTGLNVVDVLCATVFVFMFTSFIPAPGASGGAEGGFYWFFTMFIASNEVLLMTTMLWRVFTFYLPILVGSLFYAWRRK